ncbi:MAG: PQQ-like beta-propeller repeat protein [Chlorobi bacterium]|nr:PQQ-like beta-propeller repeat protein [Chlorobiota bacterium]
MATDNGVIVAFADMAASVVGKADGAVNGAPAIHSGTLYAGSSDGTLYAFTLDSHQLAWKFKGGAAFTTTPLAVEGLVVAGCDDGFIYAIDPNGNSGTLKWKYQLAGKPTSPAWKDGVVYVRMSSRHLRH